MLLRLFNWIFYSSFDSIHIAHIIVKLYINIGLSFWKASSRKVYAVPVVQNATSTMTKRERKNTTAPTMTVGDDSDESLSQLQEEKRPRLSNFSSTGSCSIV